MGIHPHSKFQAACRLPLQQVREHDKSVNAGENKAVSAAKTYLKLSPLKPAVSAPPDADPAKCTASLQPTNPTVAPSSRHCAEYMFNQVINSYAGQIVDELRNSGGSTGDTCGSMASHMKKMSPGYLTACPSDVFKDLWKLARFAQ